MAPHVTINGTTESIEGHDPLATLLQYLRTSGRTGTKEGCAEGDCGACTVALVRSDGLYEAVNSCLLPLAAAAGRSVVTVEGVAPGRDHLHPVQEALVQEGGSQCGYCTPGFVMSMFAAYYGDTLHHDTLHDDTPHHETLHDDTATDRARDDNAPDASITSRPRDGRAGEGMGILDHAIEGNLCRCTGYLPIRRACSALGGPAPDDPHLRALDAAARTPAANGAPVAVPSGRGGTSRHAAGGGNGVLAERGTAWHAPSSLEEALRLLAEHEDAMPIAGATDLGVDITKFHRRFSTLVSVEGVPDLHLLEDRSAGDAPELRIGAAVPLERIAQRLRGRLPALDEMLRLFAARQIRNRATLGGNLGTASPIGDLPPVLMAFDATIELASTAGPRTVQIADFFHDYRKTARHRDELIVAVRVPLGRTAGTTRHAQSYKVGKRGTDDISIVAATFRVDVDADNHVRAARMAYGGVAAVPIRALEVERDLIGRPWSEGTARRAGAMLRETFAPLDDHRGSAGYRRKLAGGLFEKFWTEHRGMS